MSEKLVEHIPWHGPKYGEGLSGQRIAIVGYSHHRCGAEVDTETFTQETLREVIEEDKISFFSSIRGFFGYDDSRAFWNRVLFFNFIPDCIGTTDRRYAYGTAEQLARGRERASRLLRECQPQKVFVFTKKGWSEFPPTREENAGGRSPELGSEFPGFSWGTYDVGGHIVKAFGLRHPQYAVKDQMRRAVEHVLTL